MEEKKGYKVINQEDSRLLLNQKEKIGESVILKDGSKATIVEYNHAKDIVIMFDGNPEHTRHIEYSQFKSGKVKNTYKPSLNGYGYIGEGQYTSSIDKEKKREYNIWRDMINLNPKEMVDERWHCYQQFAEDILLESNIDLIHDKNYSTIFRPIDDETIYSKGTAFIMPNKFKNIFKETNICADGLMEGITKINLKNGEYSYIVKLYDADGKRPAKNFSNLEEANNYLDSFKKNKNKILLDRHLNNGEITQECHKAMFDRWC